MHPLNDADARKDRAAEHLGELRIIIEEFERSELEAASRSSTPAGGWVFGRPDSPIPIRLRVLAGETVEHLRAALDYLAYQLALLDAGEGNFREDRIQFPIDDEPDDFRRHRGRQLLGISEPHVAVIKRFQPFNGCEWSGRLRDLSDRNKHRMLVFTAHQTEGEAEVLIDYAQSPLRIVGMNARLTIRIAFADGSLVTETLDELQSGVAAVLDAFRPEFQR